MQLDNNGKVVVGNDVFLPRNGTSFNYSEYG
jgi:hypothetical protein